MNMGLEYLPEAVADAEEVTRYYEERVPGLGSRFRAEVEIVCAAIVRNPLLWRERPGGFRRVNIPGFPLLRGLLHSRRADTGCGGRPWQQAPGLLEETGRMTEMATRKFEEEAQLVGKAVGRRHLAWAYLFLSLFTGLFAVAGWDRAFAGQGIFLGLVSAGLLVWAIVSGFPKRLRNLRCPCCSGKVVLRRKNHGALHMVCEKCRQASHLGLSSFRVVR